MSKIVYTVKKYCHIIADDNFNHTSYQRRKMLCGKLVNVRIHPCQNISSLGQPLCPMCERKQSNE
jgi:hypothetical protein